jgi:hypothetical protein
MFKGISRMCGKHAQIFDLYGINIHVVCLQSTQNVNYIYMAGTMKMILLRQSMIWVMKNVFCQSVWATIVPVCINTATTNVVDSLESYGV